MPNRAEHYRDMADECRQLATFSISSKLKSRFSEMADRYSALAEAEESATPTYDNSGNFHGSDLTDSVSRTLRSIRSKDPRAVATRIPSARRPGVILFSIIMT